MQRKERGRSRQGVTGGLTKEKGTFKEVMRKGIGQAKCAMLGTEGKKDIGGESDGSAAWEESTMADKSGRHGRFSLNIHLPPSTSQSTSIDVILCPLAVLKPPLSRFSKSREDFSGMNPIETAMFRDRKLRTSEESLPSFSATDSAKALL